MGASLKSMDAVSETLLDGKERRELTESIPQIPLSATTATRRTETSWEDVQSQLAAARCTLHLAEL